MNDCPAVGDIYGFKDCFVSAGISHVSCKWKWQYAPLLPFLGLTLGANLQLSCMQDFYTAKVQYQP